MFDELKRHADRYGCRFSLYVDDLTISSRSPISDPHFLVELMAKAMRAYGRRLKREKVKYRGARDNKVVTGVAIDHKAEKPAAESVDNYLTTYTPSPTGCATTARS